MQEMPSQDDDALHEALWIALMCLCERCDAYHDLEDIDQLADQDTWQWAIEAARRVKPLGWTSPHGNEWRSGELLCPACSADRVARPRPTGCAWRAGSANLSVVCVLPHISRHLHRFLEYFVIVICVFLCRLRFSSFDDSVSHLSAITRGNALSLLPAFLSDDRERFA